MQCMEYSKIWLNLIFAAMNLTFIRGPQSFPSVSCRSSNYQITLRSRSTFQNLESTMWLAKHGKGMLSSVEQAFMGRDKKPAPLKKPAWEASGGLEKKFGRCFAEVTHRGLITLRLRPRLDFHCRDIIRGSCSPQLNWVRWDPNRKITVADKHWGPFRGTKAL